MGVSIPDSVISIAGSKVSLGGAISNTPITKPVGPFVSTWNTENLSAGSSATSQVSLPLISSGTYDFTVDWGDGNQDTITVYNQAEKTHTYAATGTYEITITGVCEGFVFSNTNDRLKLLNISNWGTLKLGVTGNYFYGCANLDITATDIFDITGMTSMFQAFRGCSSLVWNDSISLLDTNNITSFSFCFLGCSLFNQLIDWDFSSATALDYMLYQCSTYNQPINWHIPNVATVTNMLHTATSFNSQFKLTGTSNLTNTNALFLFCSSFNQLVDIDDFSNVTTAINMHNGNTAYNQPVNHLSVVSLVDASNMYLGCSSLNQSFSSWVTSSLQNMFQMFLNCSTLDQDFSTFDFSGVTNITSVMAGCTLSTANYDVLLISLDGQTLNPSLSANFGGSQYSAGAAAAARASIIANDLWTIADGGQAP